MASEDTVDTYQMPPDEIRRVLRREGEDVCLRYTSSHEDYPTEKLIRWESDDRYLVKTVYPNGWYGVHDAGKVKYKLTRDDPPRGHYLDHTLLAYSGGEFVARGGVFDEPMPEEVPVSGP